MATYTITLKSVLEMLTMETQTVQQNGLEELITNALPILFDVDCELANFDVEFKKALCREFLFQEIAYETVALFRFHINRRFREIKDYYNNLMKISGWEDRVFENENYTETIDGTHNRTLHNDAQSNGSGDNRFSDTPEQMLSNVSSGKYLTSATTTSSNDTTTSNGTDNLNDDVTVTRKGKTGGQSISSMVKEYRESLFNMVSMFVKEFEQCFMQIW